MSIRMIRVRSDLMRAISAIFMRLNLTGAVVRDLHLSKDLRFATIEIASIDPVFDNQEMLGIINRKIGMIVKLLKTMVSLKYFPKIRFVEDSHHARIQEIESLLKAVKEKDLKAGIVYEEDENSEEE